jgi:hypothetical protein
VMMQVTELLVRHQLSDSLKMLFVEGELRAVKKVPEMLSGYQLSRPDIPADCALADPDNFASLGDSDITHLMITSQKY